MGQFGGASIRASRVSPDQAAREDARDFTNAQVCAQNALDLTAAAKMKNTGQIQERLELYKKNQPGIESFCATNAAEKSSTK